MKANGVATENRRRVLQLLESAETEQKGDLLDDVGNTIYDYSAKQVLQSILENDSLTVAGNNVALGSSTSVSIADLANVLGVTEIKMDTAANLTAGTANRLCIETDTGRVLYDNGTSFIEMGLSENQIALSNLGSHGHGELTGVTAGDHHDQPRGEFTKKVQSPAAGSPVTVDLTALNDSICFSDLYLKARVDSTSSGYDKDVEVRVWYRGDASYTVVASQSDGNTTSTVGVTWNLKDLVNGVLNVPDGNKAIVKAQAEIVTGVDTTYHTVEIKGVVSGG